MARVRSKNTAPEMVVRRLVHRLGYRYRLHAADLPGRPDLVFPARWKVIFVHGCFWHGHETCRSGTVRPQGNAAFWGAKLDRNKARDVQHIAALVGIGWSALVVWGCELRDTEALSARIRAFLGERLARVVDARIDDLLREVATLRTAWLRCFRAAGTTGSVLAARGCGAPFCADACCAQMC